jgi:hypothetical protein
MWENLKARDIASPMVLNPISCNVLLYECIHNKNSRVEIRLEDFGYYYILVAFWECLITLIVRVDSVLSIVYTSLAGLIHDKNEKLASWKSKTSFQ